jgi:PAT family beta-lactamase induction signal transducer AmpG
MLYVAQGVPLGLLLGALPAYLAGQGVPPGQIGGLVAWATLPHAIKLFNGPFMDRWTYLPMGRRRPWVLFAQMGIVLSFASLVFIPDPLTNFNLLIVGCFVVNFFVAFQDVATDGMAVDILEPSEQARAASLMVGGQGIGIAGVTAAGSFLLRDWGIGAASLACSGAVLVIMLFPLLTRERPGERQLPWSEGVPSPEAQARHIGNWWEILRNLFSGVRMPASLILIAAILVYTWARGLHGVMLPVYFIQELGWVDTQFSSMTGIASLIAALTTMTVGGMLLQRVGAVRFFAMMCIIVGLLGVSMGLLPMARESEIFLIFYRVAHATCDTLAMVAVIAISMSICGQKVAATQFAIYMGVSNLGYVFGSGQLGRLQEMLSYEQLFIMFGVISAASLFVMALINIDRHRTKLRGLEGLELIP